MLSNHMSPQWNKNGLVFHSHPSNKHFTHAISLEEKAGNSNDDKVVQDEIPFTQKTMS